MTQTFDITSPDLVEQAQQFEALPALIVSELGKTATRSGQILELGWQGVAARDTNFYANTLQMEITEIAGTLPEAQTAVFTNAHSEHGFPYPRALEDSVRYHYRSTARKGQRTAGQVNRMFKSKQAPITVLFKKLGDGILTFLSIG